MNKSIQKEQLHLLNFSVLWREASSFQVTNYNKVRTYIYGRDFGVTLSHSTLL